jgi:endonuclease YncB( thermonuclease family)
MAVGDSGPLAASVTVISHSLDKYGRVLGEVRYRKPGDLPDAPLESLADALLAAGHARVMR